MMQRCPHNSVQQFTELCLDCGRNRYESDADYLKYLQEEKRRREHVREQNETQEKILQLERELGIKHDGNRGSPEW